jgi:uroporphyrinogen-III synthase
LKKNKEGGKILQPCSDVSQGPLPTFLADTGFDFDEAVIYRTISNDLSDMKDPTTTHDMIVFFSPAGVKSLFERFPKFKQKHVRIAAFGQSTAKAVEDAGLKLAVQAPIPEAKSMTTAISLYLHEVNK